ncbi:MAG TPA: FtsW/RodA/SpoVE family cell cycle protein [Bryobacteraceae bacterium]|nr:FtsW/RodA/SpoVE family cell cycle protein [Bryobacteraceae bacterium]
MAQRLKTDWVLFFTIVAMVCFGLVIVYSASSVMAELKYKWDMYFIARQIGWAVVSFLVLMQLKRLNYRKLDNPIWAFAPLGIVTSLLVLVYFVGWKHRWLQIGPASLQPSEFAKPALVIFLAYFIALRLSAINDKHTLRPAMLALGAVAAMVVGPDLGTAIVLVLTAAILFYVAGLDSRYIAIATIAGVILVGIAIVAKPYRLSRVLAMVDPNFKIVDMVNPGGEIRSYVKRAQNSDPTYQPRQSRIAVGSGGVLGVGLMQGKQKLLYLPEAHTDYIYAVVGEELGIWGTSGVLIGFFVILWRGLRLFYVAPDNFGKYLALGVTVSVVLQALVNISVVLDVGPTKGIPLPMISYGGSSLLSTLISLGLLLSVSEHAG